MKVKPSKFFSSSKNESKSSQDPVKPWWESDDYQYSYGSSWYVSNCHKGNIEVFSIDGITVFGGGDTRGADYNSVDVILDLANVMDTDWTFPAHWDLKAKSSNALIANMYIRDFSAPGEPADFWYSLWDQLIKERDAHKGKLDVLVACMGGHGRTGTVLCCLALVSGAWTSNDVDVVEWVRKRYCDEAIESVKQITYLEDTFQVKIDSTSAKSSYSSSYTGSGKTIKSIPEQLADKDMLENILVYDFKVGKFVER
jgi:hypothetical protein